MSKAIIIDDELDFIESLKVLIDLHCPQIKVIDTASTVKEGIALIRKRKPDLIFLDINMPDGNGFDLPEKISGRNYEIIFTTSFNEFAVRAFEFSALHYLIKPIDIDELKKTINKYEKQKSNIDIEKRLNVLDGSIRRNLDKIIIPDSSGLQIVEVNDII
jgi:two-component system, LytTR family, response regulator